MDDILAIIACAAALAFTFHLMRHGLRIRLGRRRVLMGERLPRGYRVAYLNIERQYDVAYPVGIHLFVMAMRRIWESTYWYTPSAREQRIIDCRCLYDPDDGSRCLKCGVSRKARIMSGGTR